MTGTSLDGLDAALVEINGHGLAMRPRFVRGLSRPLGALAPTLRRLAEQQPVTAADCAAAACGLGRLHASVIRDLLAGSACDLVCVHGQTVYHQPPQSWQLINPFEIARELRAPVVYDLRQADLAAGGQGAPITPLADAIWIGSRDTSWAVVNLGGYCNVTLYPCAGEVDPAAILARDVCACNQVLDGVARAVLGTPFDQDGAAAARGVPNPSATADLESLLETQASLGRSLGTGDEARAWIERHRQGVLPADLAASATVAVGRTIARAVGDMKTVYLAGGGARNRALVRSLRDACQRPVDLTDSYGLPGEYREAACFAVLGALCQDRQPITLPQVTGCQSPAPISGAWAPSPFSGNL